MEILSPSSRRYDRGVKLAAYLERVSVPTVWIVDHRRREVEVCERGTASRIEAVALEWLAPGAPVPLQLDLVALFRAALGA